MSRLVLVTTLTATDSTICVVGNERSGLRIEQRFVSLYAISIAVCRSMWTASWILLLAVLVILHDASLVRDVLLREGRHCPHVRRAHEILVLVRIPFWHLTLHCLSVRHHHVGRLWILGGLRIHEIWVLHLHILHGLPVIHVVLWHHALTETLHTGILHASVETRKSLGRRGAIHILVV